MIILQEKKKKVMMNERFVLRSEKYEMNLDHPYCIECSVAKEIALTKSVDGFYFTRREHQSGGKVDGVGK